MSWFFIVLSSMALGSFANVVIYRLPLMILNDDNNLNLARPASFCPSCQKPLKLWHNIPLLSFILLKRRCGHCKALIAWRLFMVELGVLAFAIFSAIFWGLTSNAIAYFCFFYLLWILAWIDALHFLLPDLLTQTLLWLGLLYHSIFNAGQMPDFIWAAVFGFALLYLVYVMFYWFTHKEGLGFGDMKLMGAIGAWLGVTAIANVLIVACFTALSYVVIFRVLSKPQKNRFLPFGPFLAFAAIVVMLTDFDAGVWLSKWI